MLVQPKACGEALHVRKHVHRIDEPLRPLGGECTGTLEELVLDGTPRRLIDESDYVCNPGLAPLVPNLSVRQPFTTEELSAIAFFAEDSDSTTRRLLDKYVARRYVQADILACGEPSRE